MDVTKITGR